MNYKPIPLFLLFCSFIVLVILLNPIIAKFILLVILGFPTICYLISIVGFIDFTMGSNISFDDEEDDSDI